MILNKLLSQCQVHTKISYILFTDNDKQQVEVQNYSCHTPTRSFPVVQTRNHVFESYSSHRHAVLNATSTGQWSGLERDLIRSELFHPPFMELSIIIFNYIKMRTWSWSDNSIESGQTARMCRVAWRYTGGKD